MNKNLFYLSQNIIINYMVYFGKDKDEFYSNQCQIKFILFLCYNSCEECSMDIYNSNETNHNCEKCINSYYPSPIIKSNCYSLNEKEINWYLDSDREEFALCNEECKSCSGPSKNECLSCFNNSYLYLGKCQDKCELGYYAELINDTNDYYYNCSKCYENCETCKEKGNSTIMKCETCKDNYIKYKNNCYTLEEKEINWYFNTDK